MRVFAAHTRAVRALRTVFGASGGSSQTHRFQLRANAAAVALFLFSAPQAHDVTIRTATDHAVLHQHGSLYSRFSALSSPNDVVEIIKDTYYDASSKVDKFIKKQLSSQGGRDVLYITAVNAAIFALWKVAPSNFMHRHFTNSLEGMRRARVWTCMTSNFSHRGVFHLGANMYVLNKYGQDVADVLGSQRFYLFYGTAGVASSLASLSFRRLTRNHYLSLGASGAVAATLWLYASLFPKRRMSLFGSDYVISMQEFALAFTVMDVAGLLGSAGKIDFAAHVGGAVFANVWFQLVRDKLMHEQKQREQRSSWPLARFVSRAVHGVKRKESP